MASWRPDSLLPGFEALELALPRDYEGEGVATLVRLPAGDAPRGAVLYLHGFSDYFFQRHMAERFAAEGYAFHALDLRRCGRSLRPGQHPHFVRELDEHYVELTLALATIGTPVLLAGHSAGGLLCSLYAHEGERRDAVKALWLNSPFFAWAMPNARWRFKLFLAERLGRWLPYLANRRALHPLYTRALWSDWEFDTRLKPLDGFPVYCGWVRAISRAQRRLHQGLGLACPVLAMHSDEADLVLNWRDIARWSRTLGSQVTVLSFPGAVHDLVLSTAGIREAVFSALFAWAERASA
jgi:alpha-beta hydrolase superfamily lysophospholipase